MSTAMKVKVILCSVLITLSISQKTKLQDTNSFWNQLKPGELLHTLDALTIGTRFETKPINTNNTIKKINNSFQQRLRKPQDVRIQRRNSNEDDIEDHTANSFEEQHDYEKTYDDFVKKYFDAAITSSETSNNKNESNERKVLFSDEVQQSVEESNVDNSEPSTKETATSATKCKEVIKNKQLCSVCKNVLNGESSETCTYSHDYHDIEPVARTFKKERKIKKARNDNQEDESRFYVPYEDANSLAKGNTTNSQCLVKPFKNKICFYCRKYRKENVVKCYNTLPSIRTELKPNSTSSKIKNSRQRIYKRTLSYSYEN